MHRCKKCGGLMEKSVRPEHIEDLGGLVVKVLNAAQVYRCAKCACEMVAIPDMDGLARSAVIARALYSVRLAGREVKFMRRVLDMTQTEFAEAMDVAAETISRWENDAPGIGEASEKLMRHNVCALIYKATKGQPYDASVIANMKFKSLKEGETMPLLQMVRVRRQSDDEENGEWGQNAA